MIGNVLILKNQMTAIYLKKVLDIDIGCMSFAIGIGSEPVPYLSFTNDIKEALVFPNEGRADRYCEMINRFILLEFIVVPSEQSSKDKGFEPVGIIVDEFKDFPHDPVSCAKVIVENVKRLLRKIYHLEKSIDAALQNQSAVVNQSIINKLNNALEYDGQMLQRVEDFEERISKEAMELLHPLQEVKHPSKSLSEDDMKQKAEFIENQNKWNDPCVGCGAGFRLCSCEVKERYNKRMKQNVLKVLNCDHCEHHNKTYNTKICLACIEKHKLNKQHDITICRNCNHFGNPNKCPQTDPDHVSCPTAEPIERPCTIIGSEVDCDKCPEDETCGKHDIE